MKMKYALGWSDPRASYGQSIPAGPLFMESRVSTQFTNVASETLRNLWLVRFGGKAVSVQHMHSLSEDDNLVEVAQELANRGLVSEEVLHNPEYTTSQHYYVLRNEPNGNH